MSAAIECAVDALRELGGWASASDVCAKMVCPHCGHGMDIPSAQLLIQRACDSGLILIEKDFTLSLPERDQ